MGAIDAGHMTRPRVLLFSQAPGVGGGERAVMPLLTRLDIELIAVGPKPFAAYAEQFGALAHVLEFRRAHKLVHALRVASGARKLRALARRLRPHLVYANGTRAIPYALGAALLGSRPLLFHHHGVLEGGPVLTLSRAARRWTDAIVVPSRTAAEPFGRKHEKLHVVPNGVDLTRFRQAEDKAAAKRRLGVPGGAVVVGTLTRPHPTKGMNEFIDMASAVAASLPDVHFVLAGGPSFPHETAPYESVVARAAAFGPRLTITGAVEDPAVVYRALDVFVHLGEPEGFSLTVLEALASGVPVVAYDWGAIPEVFGDLAAVVAPGKVDAAAAAVTRLVRDDGLRSSAAARGRAGVELRFGLDQAAAQLGRVIESVTATSVGARRQ